ncbi:Protein 5NUC [Portunus trituberculatus]|uniref:Protein 5NUC n=2 Tax=Portunus trituberculatus TaxID=210409 RepID=A0A5B7IDG2_PORTR|nr:Protein 5NUC [Portunus trituberculatus]
MMQEAWLVHLCLWAAVTAVLVEAATFNLTILHVNDFHARYEETNVFSGRCSDEDKEKNKCYGGFAR